MKTNKVSIAKLRECFDYNPATGRFVWRERPLSHFAGPRSHAMMNTTYAGKVAGSIRKDGYLVLVVFGVRFLGHRVAWAMAHGRWPKNEVDHIDGDPSNNRIPNLRDINHESNQRNMKRNKLNSSGVNGVRFHKPRGKWQAIMVIGEKQRSLGLFDTIEEAAAARKAGDKVNGFHESHGQR